MYTMLYLGAVLLLASTDIGLFVVLGLLFLGAIIVAVIISQKKAKAKDEALKSVLFSLEDFRETDFVKGGDILDYFYFAVDDRRDKVFYYTEEFQKMFNYSNIISATLRFGNEEVISKKSALGTVGGALLGGALAGGAGAIIGGGAASTKSKAKVSSISIHVLLRDMPNPSDKALDIVCHNGELTRGEGLFDTYYSKAQRIMDLLAHAIDKVAKSSSQVESVKTPELGKKNLMEDLRELVHMKEQGLLSDDDFAKAKGKLLS